MQKHTLGPWKIEGKFIVGQRYVAELCNWYIVGQGGQYDAQNAILQEEQTANAHLIAAAPAMYEALKYVLDAYAPYADPGMPQELFIAVQKAKTALAQAEVK